MLYVNGGIVFENWPLRP